ncbi:MAG: hypothetical protein ACK4GW_04810 [Pseudorhodobacter sp.]
MKRPVLRRMSCCPQADHHVPGRQGERRRFRIWCSKGTIQRHTELGESTVKRKISDFLREGSATHGAAIYHIARKLNEAKLRGRPIPFTAEDIATIRAFAGFFVDFSEDFRASGKPGRPR